MSQLYIACDIIPRLVHMRNMSSILTIPNIIGVVRQH